MVFSVTCDLASQSHQGTFFHHQTHICLYLVTLHDIILLFHNTQSMMGAVAAKLKSSIKNKKSHKIHDSLFGFILRHH